MMADAAEPEAEQVKKRGFCTMRMGSLRKEAYSC